MPCGDDLSIGLQCDGRSKVITVSEVRGDNSVCVKGSVWRAVWVVAGQSKVTVSAIRVRAGACDNNPAIRLHLDGHPEVVIPSNVGGYDSPVPEGWI
jgi:hypothetical protein